MGNELVFLFVALIILHAKRIRGILFWSLAYISVPKIFWPYIIKGKSLRKGLLSIK